ncbi:MAG: GIY-YIG nuclease family protein [Bryobacteraceae bacterium]|jgi:hypothetical protein
MAKEVMTTDLLHHLTIDFLEDHADALRRVTQSTWQVQCLMSSRSALPGSLRKEASRKVLDVPGVYLLVGPPEKTDDSILHPDWRLYVGQADSVADRLARQLKIKKWWRTVVVIRRPDDNPLNLSQCRFLESTLCTLGSKAGTCVLTNGNAPQLPTLSAHDKADTQDLLDKAIVIVGALGFNFFRPFDSPPLPSDEEQSEQPPVPENLRQLLEEIRKAATGPSFPKAEWYWTGTPDYRVKVVNGDDFRVFLRIRWAKNGFSVKLKDVEDFKVSNSADLEEHHEKIRTAYSKADRYLQQGK